MEEKDSSTKERMCVIGKKKRHLFAACAIIIPKKKRVCGADEGVVGCSSPAFIFCLGSSLFFRFLFPSLTSFSISVWFSFAPELFSLLLLCLSCSWLNSTMVTAALYWSVRLMDVHEAREYCCSLLNWGCTTAPTSVFCNLASAMAATTSLGLPETNARWHRYPNVKHHGSCLWFSYCPLTRQVAFFFCIFTRCKHTPGSGEVS